MLHVSNEGLQVLAAHCDAVSARFAVATPVPIVGLPFQATSHAVGSAYAVLDGIIATLAGRSQASAIKAAVAGAEFVASDSTGAQSVAALGSSITQA
ncbi:hypothetical protein MSTO_56690 [Mycobacterium stomatepiae]|uniref:PE family immunomodulator PE5 n=1 Tax=Mycobacterium stomatepiae TaxID=470076 RepID=A0A7I7QGI8_9MYCO|nr:hypothetical protein MSTO_56690 [Mycobacterium stomatepiae]